MGVSIDLPPLDERIALMRDIIDRLTGSGAQATVDAIVADGWPRDMATRGLAMHARTWDPDGIVDALQNELASFGGLAALDAPSPRGARIIPPETIVHVWPALPGAGLTPCLFGWVLGSWQIARPSSRGAHLARRIGDQWLAAVGLPSLAVEEGPKASWRDADVVVVSGTDETLDAVRDYLGHTEWRRAPRLIGYGHRTSIGVVVDGGDDSTFEHAHALGRDAVMWHQQGCFSPRAIFFCGDHARLDPFADALARGIAQAEAELGAAELTHAELGRRAQARGVAEFTTQMWGDGLGWVQLAAQPHSGEFLSPHTLELHHIRRLADLPGAITPPPHALQGAALGTPPGAHIQRRAWADALARIGFNRVCAPGALQQPPPSWSHDGAPNVLDWVRVCREDA